MIWLAVDKICRETIHENKPEFDSFEWCDNIELCAEGECITHCTTINLPKGTIKRILGYELDFKNSPVEVNKII